MAGNLKKESGSTGTGARVGILDRQLPRNKGEVSMSSFSFLFSEIVQYSQNRVTSVADLERKLEEMGFGIGKRILELLSCRDRITRRETRVVPMLQYITSTIWRYLFNKEADSLLETKENKDGYMIYENNPITNTFVSLPLDLSQFNCATFIAGIIAGILDSAKFDANVTAHFLTQADGSDITVFLIKFSPEVMARESRYGST